MALLVNAGRSKRKSRSVPLKDLFAAVGGLKANRGRKGKGKSRRNSRSSSRSSSRKARRRNAGMSTAARAKMAALATMRPRDAKGRFLKTNRRSNPLVANRRKGKGKGSRRRNPLVANPLVANRRRGMKRYRRNAGMPAMMQRFAGMFRGVPVIGGMLSGTVMAVSSVAMGAIGILPTFYALRYGGERLPTWLRPFSYSLAGALLAGAAQAFLPNFAYKNALVGSIAGSGGAVDVYRKLIGASQTFGEGDYGEDLGEDMGEGADLSDGYGDAEDVRPGEFADASAYDAMYSGEDLSPEEAEYAGMGRRAFRMRFARGHVAKPGAGAGGKHAEQASEHAGSPGRRWGWLIYWVGFGQFKQLSKLDPARRRQIIQQARHAAIETTRKALETGVTDGDVSMESLEAAGLLAAA